MNSLLVKTPNIIKRLYPNRIWSLPKTDSNVYLTFDDGPIPEVTPWVLGVLNDYHAKATFFCIGKNVNRHFNLYKRILDEGHTIGNHTYNHLNGWKTSASIYLENVIKQEKLLKQHQINRPKNPLFRPPYGRLSSMQTKELQKMGFKICMWEVLSGDFSKSISKEKCLQNVIDNMKPGSIVVFHDSLKAKANLTYTLPRTLDFITSKKWKCARISF